MDPKNGNKLVEGGITEQTEQVLKNLRAILEWVTARQLYGLKNKREKHYFQGQRLLFGQCGQSVNICDGHGKLWGCQRRLLQVLHFRPQASKVGWWWWRCNLMREGPKKLEGRYIRKSTFWSFNFSLGFVFRLPVFPLVHWSRWMQLPSQGSSAISKSAIKSWMQHV